jgi:hypothetical protein
MAKPKSRLQGLESKEVFALNPAIPGLCLNAAAVQGSAMTVRALLFAPLLMAVLASGAQQVGFTSGVWTGDANYDGDGKFRDCTMTAQSENGVLLGFVISKDFDWGLVLADDSLDFELGTTEAVLLRIDARDPIPAVAKVVDVHGIVIPLENSDPVLDALRQGKVLTITAGTAKVSFKLTGTKDAIAALAACVTEHRETEKVKRLNGGRTTSRYRRA